MRFFPIAALIFLAPAPQARAADSGSADRLTPPPAPAAAAARVAPAPPPAKPAPDYTCVKKQLGEVYDYEKKFYEKNSKYSGSLEELGVPKSVIDDCPGWDAPVPRTSYGGSGFTVKSENPKTGESWSVNNEKSFIQETVSRVK